MKFTERFRVFSKNEFISVQFVNKPALKCARKMEIACDSDKCKLITHDLSTGIYRDDEGNGFKYELSRKLFNNFKRKQKDPKTSSEQNNINSLDKIKDFLKLCKSRNLFPPFSEEQIEECKSENIKLMNEFYEISYSCNEFYGENNLDNGIVTILNENKYLVPPRCKFFNKNVLNLEDFLSEDNKFDFIVLDPPWKNRYLKRLKKTCNKQSYYTMTDTEIAKIPLEKYINKSTIMVIWCTNSTAHKTSITDIFLHKWNMKLLTIWNWVKIDKCGNLFCSLEGSKKPYEAIFIATHVDNDTLDTLIEKDLCLFSHPSSIHSHKPPLIELFQHVLPSNPKCLELFARSLYKNFTSVGTEVLKLQNAVLFDRIN